MCVPSVTCTVLCVCGMMDTEAMYSLKAQLESTYFNVTDCLYVYQDVTSLPFKILP